MKKITNKWMKISGMTVILSASISLVVSCANGTALRTGPVIPSSKTQDVQVLLESPKKNYIALGLVEAKVDNLIFSSKEKSNKKALEELKFQAASLGAHAVVIRDMSTTSRSDILVGGNDDVGGIIHSETKRLSGIAILYRAN